jgi:hypothetical protein
MLDQGFAGGVAGHGGFSPLEVHICFLRRLLIKYSTSWSLIYSSTFILILSGWSMQVQNEHAPNTAQNY